MTVKEQMRACFPKTIDRTAPVFSAMVANNEGTAAFEYELSNLISYMKEWVSTPDVYGQSGDMLDKTVNFLSYFERFTDESDTSLKNRFGAIFSRSSNKVWGTPYDIKTVFEKYFPHAEIYLVENTGDAGSENLIEDGDFEKNGSGWTFKDSKLSEEARFSKSYGVSLGSSGTAAQTIELAGTESKTYFLHFFMKGNLKISVKNNAGEYWDCASKSWSTSAVCKEFSCGGWEAENLYFSADSQTTGVEIEFSGNGGQTAFFDYVRLFEKRNYPSFTVIAQFEASASTSALKLAPGRSDPDSGIQDYGDYDYYDLSFVTGAGAGYAQDLYNDLLNLLRANGVKAYLEILTKDFIEE